MKKQHRQALLLDNFLGVDGLALGRSLRDRKPVTYTFGKKFHHCLHFCFHSWSWPLYFPHFFFPSHELLRVIRQFNIFTVGLLWVC